MNKRPRLTLEGESADPLLELLRRVHGHDSFRPLQREIIEHVISAPGSRTLALLPTGLGKSACYQLSAEYLGGVTLVLSPLLALQADQVAAMRARRPASTLAVEMLNSNTSEADKARIWALLAEEHPRLVLFVAPEQVEERKSNSARLCRVLRELGSRFTMLVVDEAHVVSEWGHDFRRAYTSIGWLTQLNAQHVRVLALTATATERTRNDIVEQLHLRGPRFREFVGSFNRANIAYTVHYVCGARSREESDALKIQVLLEWIRGQDDSSGVGIVYCHSRDDCGSVAERLTAAHITAAPYHGQMSPSEREASMGGWMQGATRVICATNAFGMGVDKANVRWVVHYTAPKSLEAFYQESGRAGRDGLAARSLVLASAADIQALQFVLSKGTEEPGGEEATARNLQHFEAVLHWLLLKPRAQCRRIAVLAHFGEHFDAAECHQGCDVCADRAAVLRDLSRFESPDSSSSSMSVRRRKEPSAETDMFYEPPMRSDSDTGTGGGIITAAQLVAEQAVGRIEQTAHAKVAPVLAGPTQGTLQRVAEDLIVALEANRAASGAPVVQGDSDHKALMLEVFRGIKQLRQCANGDVVFKGKALALRGQLRDATAASRRFDFASAVKGLIAGKI